MAGGESRRNERGEADIIEADDSDLPRDIDLALTPGDPAKSLIVEAVNNRNKDMAMRWYRWSHGLGWPGVGINWEGKTL
jgi:hypothetical protein